MFRLDIITQLYRFFKSGMLLDFYVKRTIYLILRYLFVINNIFFSEKYIVEYYFRQYTKIYNFITRFTDYFSQESAYTALSVVLLSFFLLLCFLLNGAFRLQYFLSFIHFNRSVNANNYCIIVIISFFSANNVLYHCKSICRSDF